MILKLTINQIFEEAIKAHKEGKLQDAERLYSEVLKINPTNPAANNNLGTLLFSLRKLEESEKYCKKAIELKPDYAEAHKNLGIILQNLNRFDEAEVSFKKAIELKPDYAEAHFNLGNTLKTLGRLDEAEKSYKKAIELKPDYAEAHNNLGSLFSKLNRLNEAEVSFKKAIEIKPNYIGAYTNLSFTQKDLGRLDEALDSFNQVLKLDPNSAVINFHKNNLIKTIVPAWHVTMMNDNYRNSKYLEAIKLAVNDISDDSLVLDIGTGSGLLSMMAIANGAREVVACEITNTIAKIAKKIIHKNGYAEKITVINKKSTELKIGEDLPKKVDLIISEILAAQFVGEGVRSSIFDANKRLLKKDGIIIPESGTIKISLLGSDKKILDVVSVTSVNGFDLSEFNSITQNKWNMNLTEIPTLLSGHKDAFNINLYNEDNIVNEEKIIELKANQDGLCLGIIQWMKIKLYKDIEYENIPGTEFAGRSHWPTPLYLFDKPVTVKKGNVLKIRAILGDDNVWFGLL